MALAIFSPTTEPIDPPIKAKSIAAITKSLPKDLPTAVLTASFNLVFSCAAFNLSGYFLVSSNFKGSLEVKLSFNSSNLFSSKNNSKYSLLPILT